MINSTQYKMRLARVATVLGQKLDAYHGRSAASDDTDVARAMVQGYEQLFRTMLPQATHEMLAALTSLCAVESARQRLEEQTDNGALPRRRVLGNGGVGQ